MGAQKRRAAFTLLELVVVLAIGALMLAVVVPKVGALYERQLVEEQVRVLETELGWLRAEAQRSGETAIFERLDEQRYRLTVRDADGAHTDTHALLDGRLSLEATSRSGRIVFYPRGTAYEKCTLVVRAGAQQRTVVVNNLGRIRVGVREDG